MLQIKDLKINTKDGKEIIEKANLVLSAGQIVKLTGENGSGKTSFLNAIFKHFDYDIVSGDVLLSGGGDEVAAKSILSSQTFEMVRSGMYLGQQFVPEIQGVSNIKFLYKAFQNIYPEDKKNIIDFKNELEKYCDDFEIDKTLLSRDINFGFSGGQKKIFEMLHILALKPKYIFLDEIDSGVDEFSKIKIYNIINHIQRTGAAFLITSHDTNIKDYIDFDAEYIIENKILKAC